MTGNESIGAAWRRASQRIDRLDARLLLEHVCQIRHTDLIAHPERELTTAQAARFDALLERRTAGEPFAYLVGNAFFCGLEFAVSPAVLIPREDTGVLVAQALERAKAIPAPAVVDLGTGSGIVAIVLAKLCPNAEVTAVDVSPAALAVARTNAERHGVHVRFLLGDWYSPLGEKRFDLIVSNPPYVDAEDFADMPAEYHHEPELGLACGDDGLNLVRRIAHRVCVMQQGCIVEQADCETLFQSPQHPYTQELLAAEPSGGPANNDVGPPLLEVDDLKVWFPIKKGFLRNTVDYVKAVDGINFSLPQGQTLGIVGESGSGKSTLGLAILRLIGSQGGIRFEGQQLDRLSQQQVRPLRREMQVVFQDPFGSLSPRMSVQQIISEGLLAHDIGTEQEREAAVIRVLQEVGLDPQSRHRYPHEFSGGQRQRISIARALVMEPELILLDEPTSALDRTVQKQVVDLLRDLQARHGLTYLFISHDLAVVHALAHDMIVIKDGKVVEQGDAQSIFDNPQHPYTRELLQASSLKTQEAALADAV